MPKILVVDDNYDILQLLIDEFTDEGYDVILAEDGRDGLEQIYRHRPDIVILDLTMPVLTGYDVLRELRSDPSMKDLPVILLSAINASEGEQIAALLGATCYTKKPWEREHLLALINSTLKDAKNPDGHPTAKNGIDQCPNPTASSRPGSIDWRSNIGVLSVLAQVPAIRPPCLNGRDISCLCCAIVDLR